MRLIKLERRRCRIGSQQPKGSYETTHTGDLDDVVPGDVAVSPKAVGWELRSGSTSIQRVDQATISADQSVSYINKLMPSIASAAAVTEVKKIRDELVAIRETLKTMPN